MGLGVPHIWKPDKRSTPSPLYRWGYKQYFAGYQPTFSSCHMYQAFYMWPSTADYIDQSDTFRSIRRPIRENRIVAAMPDWSGFYLVNIVIISYILYSFTCTHSIKVGSRPFVLNCSEVNPELPKRRLVVSRPIDSEPFSSVLGPLNIDSQTSCLPLWQHGAVDRMSVSMSTHQAVTLTDLRSSWERLRRWVRTAPHSRQCERSYTQNLEIAALETSVILLR